ncbi:MAG TPA: MarR family transcriptional regulator [Longimicrobiaceae bacterium]|nr:MarR family transcriptional regulator [Longimicrobiaceae bacterium]
MNSLCYCTSLRAAARRVTAIYDDALAPVEVNVAQFALLRRLASAGPLSVKDLAAALELERSTVTRNVRVLAKLRLLELGGSEEDRRMAVIRLTDEGRRTLLRGEPLWESAQRRIESVLGSEDAAGLRATLQAL